MSVNKYYFTKPTEDLAIEIPIEIKWDFYGRTDSVEKYEKEVIEDVIGIAQDFEIMRFAHKADPVNNKTQIKYKFSFFSGANVLFSSPTDWVTTYIAEGFTADEIYYYNKPFTKSFFKLDFYDTPDPQTQINYITVILPVQQGSTESVSISPLKPNVNIRKPEYTLDYVGDKEGFFIYWLRKQEFLDLSTFYMTAKFFNGRTGEFVKMTNTPQSNIVANPFIFDGQTYFYNKVELDINTKTYEIFDSANQRIGNSSSSPITWYEYVNP